MRTKQGFAVMEIIVVLAIIAILIAVITPNIFRTVEKAKIARVMSDTMNLRAAAIGYYSDIGLWPPDVCPDEDPGFVRWDAYKTRCCGQDYDVLEDMALANGEDYNVTIQNFWDGPYLEKFPSPTPWGGDYDWEFWPHAPSYDQPSGVYVSVRDKWIGKPICSGDTHDPRTEVPDRYEIKMQQMGLDTHCGGAYPNSCTTANKNNPSGLVIIPIMHFNFSE